MLLLYWLGRDHEEMYGSPHLLALYLLGGIGGGLLMILFTGLFPGSIFASNYVYGASASVFAVMTAVATFYPDKRIGLLLLGPVKVSWLIGGLLFLDLITLAGVATRLWLRTGAVSWRALASPGPSSMATTCPHGRGFCWAAQPAAALRRQNRRAMAGSSVDRRRGSPLAIQRTLAAARPARPAPPEARAAPSRLLRPPRPLHLRRRWIAFWTKSARRDTMPSARRKSKRSSRPVKTDVRRGGVIASSGREPAAGQHSHRAERVVVTRDQCVTWD